MGETTSNPFQFKLGAQTHVGCVRTNNEDNFIVSADLASGEWLLPRSQNLFTLGAKGAVLVVADGMGGLDAGEVASRIAVDTVKTCFAADQITDEVVKDEESIRRYMRNVVVAADGNIKRRSKEEKTIQAMGTTLVVAWLIGEYAYIAWCGDSRAYRYNPLNGIEPLSCDHSYVQELVNQGVIRYEDTFEHPQGNIVTRSLGDPGGSARPESREFNVCDGDIILLCSDGLSGVLRDCKTLDENGNYYPGDTIEDVIAANCDTLTNCREALMQAAERADWYDNVTVILCQIMSGAGRAVKKQRTTASVTPINNNNSNNGGSSGSGNNHTSQPGDKKKWLIGGIAALCVIAAIAGAYWAGTRSGGDQPDNITQANDTVGKKDSTTIVAGTDITPEANPETTAPPKTGGNKPQPEQKQVTAPPVKEKETTSSLDKWKADQQKIVADVAAMLKGNSGLNWLINDVTGKIERSKTQDDIAFTTTWVKQLQRRAEFIIRLNNVAAHVSGDNKNMVGRIFSKLVNEKNIIDEGTFKSFDKMLDDMENDIENQPTKDDVTQSELTTVTSTPNGDLKGKAGGDSEDAEAEIQTEEQKQQ